ncbi:MAG: hypothetical protein AAGI01_15235, partial [Myxococcota bacterium]
MSYVEGGTGGGRIVHHSRRAIWRALFMWALAVLVWSGCDSPGVACAFDSDCGPSGEVCAALRCLAECTEDADCADEAEREDPLTCQAYTRTIDAVSLNVCARPEWLTEELTRGACTTDAQCEDLLDSADARCGLLGTCIIPELQHAIVIVSRAPANSAGPMLYGVHVEDPSGAVVAAGLLEMYDTASGQDAPASELFRGEPVDLDQATGLCPRRPEVVQDYAMGEEDGQIRLSFLDSAGMRRLLESGQSLVVLARGELCGAAEPGDEYDVRFCVSRVGDPPQNDTDCGV